MSSFDPLSALALDVVAAAQQAIAQATLDLGVSAEVLQSQVSVGDVVPALILPASGGSDLLSFLGQTVVAALPQGVYPGETLALQVTGFSGNQILVRNLGVADPNNLPPPVAIEPTPGTPVSATLQTQLPAPAPAAPPTGSAAVPNAAVPNAPTPIEPGLPSQGAVTPPNGSPAAPSSPPSSQSPTISVGRAPSSAVFVAAALRAGSPGRNAPAPPVSVERSSVAPVQAEIEARIAAARTSTPEQVARGAASSESLAESLPSGVERPVILPRQAQAPPASPSAKASPEEVLLTRLRIPVTPLTLAAARIAGDGARAIPRAFAGLERALAALPAGDPRIPSLRGLLSFTGRIDPSNTRALTEQLTSFISNVLDGREGKVATLARAFLASSQTTDAPGSPSTTSAGAARALQTAQPLAMPPTATQAQIVERSAALEMDVKSAVMALLQNPPEGSAPGLPAALGSALTAITAVQLNALNAQQNTPNAMVISLPVFYREGGAPTQLRIARDAANGKRMDGDSFHVAFVLETSNLGTVAIDLQSAGRTVSVNVKTERSPAAQNFRSTLGDLRSRLEHLRYRVASIAADVAPVRTEQPSQPAGVQSPERANERGNAQVDLRA